MMEQLQWLADNGFYLSIVVMPSKRFSAFLGRWDRKACVHLSAVDNLDILLSVIKGCAMEYLAGNLTSWEIDDARS